MSRWRPFLTPRSSLTDSGERVLKYAPNRVQQDRVYRTAKGDEVGPLLRCGTMYGAEWFLERPEGCFCTLEELAETAVDECTDTEIPVWSDRGAPCNPAAERLGDLVAVEVESIAEVMR